MLLKPKEKKAGELKGTSCKKEEIEYGRGRTQVQGYPVPTNIQREEGAAGALQCTEWNGLYRTGGTRGEHAGECGIYEP